MVLVGASSLLGAWNFRVSSGEEGKTPARIEAGAFGKEKYRGAFGKEKYRRSGFRTV